MKILVCIKQIAETDAELPFTANSPWLREGGSIAYRMNRYDEYALEEALLLKDNDPAGEIHAISVGPQRVTSALRRALAKGADYAVHIPSPPGFLPAYETAAVIAEYARKQSFDLVCAGVMSEDAMQGQVGPMLARLLSFPCAVSVVGIEHEACNNALIVQAELEGGMIEQIRVSLPAVVTIQTSVHTPRYPSLSNILRAKAKELVTLPTAAQPAAGQLPLSLPSLSTKGIVIGGNSADKAAKLLEILHERAFL